MALGAGSLIEIVMNMNVNNGQVLNVFQYEATVWPPSANAVQGAEAWWNAVKTTYRAMAYGALGSVFRTVRIRELNNPTGAYAEFDIPPGEQIGNRTGTPVGEALPYFNAAGVRLVVGTRATRPGQKRVPFLWETDNAYGVLQASFTGLLVNWCAVVTTPMVLGAPALTATLVPIITRKNAAGDVTEHQPITGYLINTNITSQNTRKVGRGA